MLFPITCLLLVGILPGMFKNANGNKITHTIITESKPAGATGMLNCTVLSRTRSQLMWQKLETDDNNVTTPVLISIDRHVAIRNRHVKGGLMKYEVRMNKAKQKGWTFTLIIRALTSDDSGQYKCVLMLDGIAHNEYPHQIGYLVVQTPPKLDRATSTTQVDTIEGQDVSLVCKATGNPEPKISWSRPNGAALPNGQLTIYGEILKLKNITDHYAGLYRCKADNSVRPPDWFDIPIRVFRRPKIKPFRKTVGQAPDKNNEVELSCLVKGNPKPEMSWWRDVTHRIMDDYKHEVQTFDLQTGMMNQVGNYMTSMRINNVQAGDYGNYTCMAENTYGRDSTTIRLFYTPTCQGPNCVFETRYRISNSGHSDFTVRWFILWIGLVFASVYRSI